MNMNGQRSMKEAIEKRLNFETITDNGPPMKLKTYIQLETTFDPNIEFKDGRFQYRVEPIENGEA